MNIKIVKIAFITLSLIATSHAFAGEYCFGSVNDGHSYKIDAINYKDDVNWVLIPPSFWTTNSNKAHCFKYDNTIKLYRADGTWPTLTRYIITAKMRGGTRTHELSPGYYELDPAKTTAYYRSAHVYDFHSENKQHFNCGINYTLHFRNVNEPSYAYGVYETPINGKNYIAFNYTGGHYSTNHVVPSLYYYIGGTVKSRVVSNIVTLDGQDLPSSGLAPGEYNMTITCGSSEKDRPIIRLHTVNPSPH